MTVDLALASKLSPPVGAPHVGKGGGPPHETQQGGADPDDAEFVTLLSTIGGDGDSRGERSSTEPTGSNLRPSRQANPESASGAAPPGADANPRSLSAPVNASLVNLTWSTLLGRASVSEAAVPQAEGANTAQRQSADQTFAHDHGRLATDAQLPETIRRVEIKSLETHFRAILSDAPVFENVLQRESLDRARSPADGEPLSVSASPGAQSRVEETPDQGRPGITVDAASSETIRNVSINSLETRFPAVISNMLGEGVPGRNADDQRNVSIHIARSPQMPEPRQLGAPTRILTIELEPASLGTVTVKMRMSRSNVDVQIKVDSIDALQTLNNARDKLVEAIQSSGRAVDSYTIQVNPTSASADSSRHMTGDGGQNAASSGSEFASRANIGREGAGHGARNDSPREDPHDPGERAPSDVKSPRFADRVHGLYL